jgi:protein-arginine kinase
MDFITNFLESQTFLQTNSCKNLKEIFSFINSRIALFTTEKSNSKHDLNEKNEEIDEKMIEKLLICYSLVVPHAKHLEKYVIFKLGN